MVRTFIQFFALGGLCGLVGVTLGCAAAHLVELEHPVGDSLALGQAMVQRSLGELLELGSPFVQAALAQLAKLSSELELKRLDPWPYLPPLTTLLRLGGLGCALGVLGALLRRFGPELYGRLAFFTSKIVREEAQADALRRATQLPDWWRDVRTNLPAKARR